MGFTFFNNILATLFTTLVVQAIEFQDGLGRSQTQSVRGTPSDDFGIHLESWDLTEGIHINSTSNFVFETVNSLLQHWPNTRYRNGKSYIGSASRLTHFDAGLVGHTLVPATIPKGTLLYHGTYQAELPTV